MLRSSTECFEAGTIDAALSLLDEMEESSGGKSMPLLNNRLMILMMADRAEGSIQCQGRIDRSRMG